MGILFSAVSPNIGVNEPQVCCITDAPVVCSYIFVYASVFYTPTSVGYPHSDVQCLSFNCYLVRGACCQHAAVVFGCSSEPLRPTGL